MSYIRQSAFEHRFWLQVMGDHAIFMLHTLSPTETEYIQKVQYFIQCYDQLLEQARRMDQATAEQWKELARHAHGLTEQFRGLKLEMISDHLECDINIGLPPSFLNHMVNELEEYLRVLQYLVRGEQVPYFHPVHHHNVWLLDAAGHAAAVQAELDPTEKKWAESAEAFEKTFEDFYIKAQEMAGFLRARHDLFPALQQFNKETSLEIALFYNFLKELEEMRLECRKLGTLMPLMADHMAREECYYLIKLHEIDPENVKKTTCDPTQPRVKV